MSKPRMMLPYKLANKLEIDRRPSVWITHIRWRFHELRQVASRMRHFFRHIPEHSVQSTPIPSLRHGEVIVPLIGPGKFVDGRDGAWRGRPLDEPKERIL